MQARIYTQFEPEGLDIDNGNTSTANTDLSIEWLMAAKQQTRLSSETIWSREKLRDQDFGRIDDLRSVQI